MILGLTYNLRNDFAPSDDDPPDRFEEFDSEETIEALEQALAALGHQTHGLGWGGKMLAAIGRLEQNGVRLDGVFNLAEGFGGRGRESQVPAVLELLGVPHSGSSALALGLTLDKALAKHVAGAAGIATAPFAVAHPTSDLDDVRLRYPLFVKLATEGSSMGITALSLCRTEADLRSTVATLLGRYGSAVLIEEFLPGQEFTVGIVGSGASAEVIGVMQVVPRRPEPDFIYSLEVKRDWANRVDYLVPAPIPAALMNRIERLALAVHAAFGCRDVSRVDVRCDRYGDPNFVEVNPLPGINPRSSDLVILARGMGWSYEHLIGRIIGSAIERWTIGGESRLPAGSRASRPATSGLPDLPSAGGIRERAGDGRRTRVAILYNDDHHLKPHLNPIELRGEEEVGESAADVRATLEPGHTCQEIALADSIGDAICRLEEFSPDVIVHLCEGALGRPEWEPNVSLLLEMMGLPHTGCDPIAAALCQDKGRVKALLQHAGFSTPPGVVIDLVDDSERHRGAIESLIRRYGRAIVKPVREDGGIGIDAGSVVDSIDRALEVAGYAVRRYRQPALIEAFIDGAELNQAIYWNRSGAVLLPPGEVVFDPSLTVPERVVGWKAKWDAGSREDRATVSRTPAEIDEELRDSIQRLCLSAAGLLGLTRYCRFDLRQDAAGALYIIDINPNPDIGPGSGFRRALAAAGISFREFLEQLMMSAAPPGWASIRR